MVLRNDICRLNFFGFLAGRRMIEVASMLDFTKPYDVFVTLLEEKRIYILYK